MLILLGTSTVSAIVNSIVLFTQYLISHVGIKYNEAYVGVIRVLVVVTFAKRTFERTHNGIRPTLSHYVYSNVICV